jgi:polyhydroxybutyrate depolymerase
MRLYLLFLTVLLTIAPAALLYAGPEHTRQRMLTVDGQERTYLVHVPPSYAPGGPVPLVLAFHGMDGDGTWLEKIMRFSILSDRNGFLAVYPNAVAGHWNDGRASERFAEQDAAIDDVRFVREMLRALRQEFVIDTTRIFAAGVSNGGMFVQRLAIEQGEIFAAVASVAGSIPEPLKDRFHAGVPVSVLFINGTQDAFVPYEGGEVTFDRLPGSNPRNAAPDRGRVLSTDASISLWIAHNRAHSTRLRAKIPDHEPRDGATTDIYVWSGGERDTYVSLYKVVGGGHTVPGGSTYIPPKEVLGNICTDFDATEAIWLFFKYNARK